MSSVGPVAMQHLRAAAAAFEAGDLATAHAAARSALQIAPGSADAFNLMGLIEFQRGEFNHARDALEAAVGLNPRYANAWHNLAGVLQQLGREGEAIDAAYQSLELGRGAPYEAWYNLGVRAYAQHRRRIAADCFERALKLRPDDGPALNNLAVVRDAEHRGVEARALAERLLSMSPLSLAAQHTFAAIWSKSTEPRDLERAMQQAAAVLAVDPAHAGAHECAAIIYGKAPDLPRAIGHAREAVRHGPDQIAYRITLLRLLEHAGNLDEAQAAFDAAPAAMQDDATLLRWRGTIALRRGDAEAAQHALERAVLAAPDDQSALAQLALALHQRGDADNARALVGMDRFLHAIRLEVPAPFTDAATFNAALAKDIRNHSRLRFEPVGLAAKAGYLTEDLLADRTPAIIGFERSLRDAIDAWLGGLAEDASHPFLKRIPRQYHLNVWATRVAAQGLIDTHIHEASWLSGAYYVELPAALGSAGSRAGWIEFGRPHHTLPQLPEDELHAVEPQVGTLLVFPSYVFHRTLPFDGEGERISISFDLSPLR